MKVEWGRARGLYCDHLEHDGEGLFPTACRHDPEGIFAKHKFSPYLPPYSSCLSRPSVKLLPEIRQDTYISQGESGKLLISDTDAVGKACSEWRW